ncbi:MAG: DUF1156 domain-containing protein [Leptospiraceae bacterium]|nr:DUF1156 domain-containing protein [Leptospiraceae bacterium]
MTQPKRLIEVDLPIKRISDHSRREKSIRHGHISTLHIWWARRPLAACRAVLCAALWPAPTDENCPELFLKEAERIIGVFAKTAASDKLIHEKASQDIWKKWVKVYDKPEQIDTMQTKGREYLQELLYDFISDFANWDNSTNPHYLQTARDLTLAAHESMGGAKGTRPMVVDPFAGGGSIPLEALRVGADVFASDLNPIPVLLNKVTLEYIPKYGAKLAEEVRKWGDWIKQEAEKELTQYYPKDKDGATPIAYLWARTIQCEGPACGATVPLMRSLWLAKKSSRSVALQFEIDKKKKTIGFKILPDAKAKDVGEGTVQRGNATCPVCGYTTAVASVRKQFKLRKGGADDAMLFCVVTTHSHEQGRFYRLPTDKDLQVVRNAKEELERRITSYKGEFSLVPTELTPRGGGSGAGRAFSQRNYGMEEFRDLFTARQLLALTTLVRLVNEATVSKTDLELEKAVKTSLAFLISKISDLGNALNRWEPVAQCPRQLFGRQAIPMIWDFAEGVSISDSSGSWSVLINRLVDVINNCHFPIVSNSNIQKTSAALHPLADESVDCFFTDPPYYDAVPYADLSDFFYVWLKRSVGKYFPELFKEELTNKVDECIVDEVKGKDNAYFMDTMQTAMSEGRRILADTGIGIVVFAHKSTAGWEAQLQSMLNAGWVFTASWPIDTEMGSRLRAMNSAALSTSIHLVCRPRQPLEFWDGKGSLDGKKKMDAGLTGDWRDVLQELPKRIRDWMPRMAREGIVGADAIFACLGPALEVFSKYEKVEKPNGDVVTLREYLEKVWETVSREALHLVFQDLDTEGLEADARVTAIWLWTLAGDANDSNEESSDEEEEDTSGKPAKVKGGFSLDSDTANRIAQGLGAELKTLPSLIEVKGETSRLLPVKERSNYLFGKVASQETLSNKKKKTKDQNLFSPAELGKDTEEWSELSVENPGQTNLDRLHQAMLLFAAGRTQALKRFLTEEAGKDERFWKLAQALNSLYPKGTEERRWVEGVQTFRRGV